MEPKRTADEAGQLNLFRKPVSRPIWGDLPVEVRSEVVKALSQLIVTVLEQSAKAAPEGEASDE